jgi:hypothetical protein
MRSKKAAETVNVLVDFSHRLSIGELLAGTPVVSEVGTSDLTLSNPIVPTADTTVSVLQQLALSDRCVQFTVEGGTAGTTYVVRITVSTDATYAQTLVQEVQLRVN